MTESSIKDLSDTHLNLGETLDFRGTTDFAFGSSRLSDAERGEFESLVARTRSNLVETLPPFCSEAQMKLRNQTYVMIPAYNEEETIGNTLYYVCIEHQIPPSNVTVVNSFSTDGTANVVRDFSPDINLVDQEEVLETHIKPQMLLDIIHANSFKEARGKGLALFAGGLDLLKKRIIHIRNERDTHITYLDADTSQYGIGQYDPLSAFAGIRKEKGDFSSIKPAKNGRNNQPVYAAVNALSVHGKMGVQIKEALCPRQWQLSGEMSRPALSIKHQVGSTGYPVETTMNISDHELGFDFFQYSDSGLRGDGQNTLEKETIMYRQILATLNAIVAYDRLMLSARCNGTIPERAAHQRTQIYKKITGYSAGDIAMINGMLSEEHITFVPDETSERAKGVDVVSNFHSRLIPSIQELKKIDALKFDLSL